jgi:phage-related protein
MIEAIFYKELNGSCPVLDFLARAPLRARAQAADRIGLLKARGQTLRRPHADYLRDGIHELRWRSGRVNFRLLYFFHGRTAVVLTNGLTKEDVVPETEINRAITRKLRFEANPSRHTYQGEPI